MCSANLTMVPLLSLVVFVASKTWKKSIPHAAAYSSSDHLDMQNLGNISKTHRHLSSFNTQVLPHIVQRCHGTVTVEGQQTQSQDYFQFSEIAATKQPCRCLPDLWEEIILQKYCLCDSYWSQWKLTVWPLNPLHCLDWKTQRTCRSSNTPSGTGQHWILLQIKMLDAWGWNAAGSYCKVM